MGQDLHELLEKKDAGFGDILSFGLGMYFKMEFPVLNFLMDSFPQATSNGDTANSIGDVRSLLTEAFQQTEWRLQPPWSVPSMERATS